jgi:hypothetical protein
MKRKSKAPYIQNSGKWPACGWTTCGIFYESMKQDKIYLSIETVETSSGKMPPRFLVGNN